MNMPSIPEEINPDSLSLTATLRSLLRPPTLNALDAPIVTLNTKLHVGGSVRASATRDLALLQIPTIMGALSNLTPGLCCTRECTDEREGKVEKLERERENVGR